MGKNRHSKDKIFISATEWAVEYGGKKDKRAQGSRPLPFDRCAISLCEYSEPVCLNEGVIFDLESLMEYLLKHKKNPITGAPASARDIIRLHMTKSDDGYWMCPVTNKALTNHSHVVAIKTTGNVFIYEAVNELNLKTKNYTDLINGEAFERSDIITLQNPDDDEHMALRDINKFAHIQAAKEEDSQSQSSDSNIRFNPTAEKVMREIEQKKSQSMMNGDHTKKNIEDYIDAMHEDTSYKEDIQDILAMKPTVDDVNPGQVNTDGKASSSFTSTVMPSYTSNSTRLATPEEIREALCKKIRALGKKGYVQVQTELGNLNLEIQCDITPRTAWNFLSLSSSGYYKDTTIHRLVTGFMVQGGDPTGTGHGGESLWKAPFKDEFDSRLSHDKRGTLSMANSGMNTNGSQFFITLAPTPHLNLRHAVFGKLVGGAAVLDRIEAIGHDKKEKPLLEIKVLGVEVFTNPIDEAMIQCKQFIAGNIAHRLQKTNRSALPKPALPLGPAKTSSSSSSSSSSGIVGLKRAREEEVSIASAGPSIGKYLQQPPSSKQLTSSASTSATLSSRPPPAIVGIGGTSGATASQSRKPAASVQDDKVAAFLKSQKSNLSLW